MHNQRYPQIDRQTIDTYQTDGVVLLKGAFTAWIDGLAKGVAELMANPSEYGHARTVVPKDGSAPFSRTTATGHGSPILSSLSGSRRRRK